MIWKRNMPAFALVAAWALIAIAVANNQHNNIVHIFAFIAAIIILANVIVQSIQNRKR